MAPVMAGLVKMTDYDEVRPDGNPKIDLGRVCDLNEGLIVKAENEQRGHKAAEAKARQRSKRGGR